MVENARTVDLGAPPSVLGRAPRGVGANCLLAISSIRQTGEGIKRDINHAHSESVTLLVGSENGVRDVCRNYDDDRSRRYGEPGGGWGCETHPLKRRRARPRSKRRSPPTPSAPSESLVQRSVHRSGDRHSFLGANNNHYSMLNIMKLSRPRTPVSVVRPTGGAAPRQSSTHLHSSRQSLALLPCRHARSCRRGG
jgi:hypothetical protein